MSRLVTHVACGLVAGVLLSSGAPVRGAPARRGGVRRGVEGRRGAKLDARTRRLLEVEANKRFRRGTLAYRKGDYEAALRHYNAAADLVYRPSLSYNIALCYEKLNNPEQAVIHLRRYLASKPPPAWAARARKRAARLLKIARVAVKVTSYPAGAAIYLDGRGKGVRGRTPFTMRLPPGSYTLYVEAGGYLPATKEIVVDVGKPNYHDFQLKRQSSLRISVSVVGAKVILDNEDPGKAQLAPVNRVVTPGRHTVRVVREGYYPVTRQVDVRPGDQASLFVDLRPTPRFGYLRVMANVAGATVRVEQDEVGETPLEKHRLQVGTYRVYVIKKGYQTWEQRVTITAKQTTLARIKLTRSTSKRQMAWFISGTVVSGLLLSSGLIMTLTAANTRSEYEDLPRASLRRQGRTYALSADVLFATGILMGIITGFVTWRLRPSAPTGTVMPMVGPDFAGVSYGGQF